MAMRRTTLAANPAGIATHVMLFLPDWKPDFDLVDNVSAGQERIVSMCGHNADPNGTFADFEQPFTMHAGGIQNIESPSRFSQHLLTFLDRNRLVDLILESGYITPLVAISNPAFEARISASPLITQRITAFVNLNRFFLNQHRTIH